MRERKCIIVIPIYRGGEEVELESFRQCLRVLSGYDIAVVTHAGVDLGEFRNIAAENEKELKIELFDAHYFAGVAGYNSLCLDKAFYERFVGAYEYMLIYQLDAWVFSDQLQAWCDKGYDYVGAPFFFKAESGQTRMVLAGVGNGGLSLRRLQYCIDVLNLPKHLPYLTPAALFKRCYFAYRHCGCPAWKSMLRLFKYVAVSFGWHNTLSWFMQNRNEDFIFSWHTQHSWFLTPKLPSPKESSTFAFEKNPSFLYELNGRELPFGCHAFEKYEYEEFWGKFIRYKSH